MKFKPLLRRIDETQIPLATLIPDGQTKGLIAALKLLPPGFFRLAVLTAGLALRAAAVSTEISDLEAPPHNYRTRPPTDRFSRMQAALNSGEIPLDRSSEKAFLVSLLKALDIPASSQMLIFSTTSLQLSLISPSNPRALYFNEDTYLGFIPGGRIEIVSIDPALGGIFYIFEIPRGGQTMTFERSNRCMNCHARESTGDIPGLVVKSVIPGSGGGSLVEHRLGKTGHAIALEQRFGGWHVTGAGDFTNHLGNRIGKLSGDTLTTQINAPGDLFSYSRYPVAASDLLPQLVHEHQVGFVNRAIQATYLFRQLEHADQSPPTAAEEVVLDDRARELTRYLLFADEVPLPPGGVAGDPAFKSDFLQNRRTNADGASLKDFDLRARLFRHRCSYMIYSQAFAGLPASLKTRVYRRLGAALASPATDAEYRYLSAKEKEAIQSILRQTLADLPAGW